MREIVLQRHLLCWQNTIAVAVSQTQSCSIFFERARERDREKGTFKVKSLGSYYLSSSKSSSPPQTGKERCGWKKESKKEWNLNYVLAIRTNSLFPIAALETRLPWPSQSKSHTFLSHTSPYRCNAASYSCRSTMQHISWLIMCRHSMLCMYVVLYVYVALNDVCMKVFCVGG